MATAPSPSRALVVFARAPEPGQVKTRLAREIGEAAALEAYRALGTAVLAAVGELGECELVVAYTPSDREELVRAWLGGASRYEAQREGDLGTRMLGAIAARCAAGAGKVLLIGTDCPEVDTNLLETAFALLDQVDAVTVGWDGTLYDCDFNQMLELPVSGSGPRTIFEATRGALEGRPIATGPHCFGCTAGAGSSCGGAIA